MSYSHLWPIDPAASKKPADWPGWPGNKRFALILTHDVETAKGQENCRHLAILEKELGFCSSFNFVPERYSVSDELRRYLSKNGFEVGVHGLLHDGKLFHSRDLFFHRASRINRYLNDWKAVGFRSPAMHHNLDWIHDLNIEYDASTFDTDPFEPQADPIRSIFPVFIQGRYGQKGYVELPYTLPQDFTVFVLMKEKSIAIWKRKLAWIVENGGMALLITHPDYMNFKDKMLTIEEYSFNLYKDLLQYIKHNYENEYWHVLPRDISRFWLSMRSSENRIHSRKS